MNKSVIILLMSAILSLLHISTRGQENVKLQDCIAIALKDNYSVTISSNELSISKNNISLAPFLPTVTLGSKQSTSELHERSYNAQGEVGKDISKATTILSSANL
ncbi:MAG TPA: hypothetical protein PLG03_02870, partial [Bacteroidales bacterium]|nr:hypothetical protein [Bacteroidales bacterium]